MKYKVGDKVWVRYGYSYYRGKILGICDYVDDDGDRYYIVRKGLFDKIERPEWALVIRY